ncbi:MAG TPA: response regulator [Steroidobacteraceae bacterium]|jgi:DNA-binding response OmpR family regulator|nr:response regulator [Steroidobacteraceae bacterium]
MSRNVLIVDDSLTVRMDLAEAFEAAGLHAILCGTLAEARAALTAHDIDLAVLDVMLPDGDGVSLLEEIRAGAAPDLPVLMLSGETEVKDRIRGMRKGANDYVGKPYDTGHVVARATELLRLGDSGDASADQRTVLVIDDSLTFREELKEALEGAGFRVVTADSGEQGLKLAATRRPAALIVDGVMPGIDGSTVIRRVRLDAALRGLPCLLLTASAQRDAELKALESGADAFVHKGEDLDVVLARFTAMLRSTQTEADRGTSLSSPKRVLAVDDSLTYLHELAGVLRDEGYDVVLAHSGEEALEVLEVQSVDCILLDLMMPGMGGQETCKRIKASTALRNIPLIMLTAVENRRALIEGLSTGADDYISKSSELDVLRARIQAQIRRKQFEDENRRIRDQLLRSELEAAEARAARELAVAKSALVEELEYKNRELESFSYSVSHDLRAPLRSIDGFSQALVEDCADQLDETGKNYLQRIRASAQRMGALIDDMLLLARISRTQVNREAVDLSAMAHAVIDELAQHSERKVAVDIQPGLILQADRGLMRVLLDNLLGNAWKFTARAPAARIELRAEDAEGSLVISVKDNGAGFDMAHAANLFQPFQRLHTNSDFPGTGIGLATVQRVIDHHGGRIWAKAAVGEGAMISFTVPETRSPPIHEPPQADSAGRRQ